MQREIESEARELAEELLKQDGSRPELFHNGLRTMPVQVYPSVLSVMEVSCNTIDNLNPRALLYHTIRTHACLWL
jgi:hypothetical protein